MTKIAVTVHENNEVTLKDERGLPVVCKDCRFAGWLTEWEFDKNALPCTCLHYSGGADPREGDRVILDDSTSYPDHDYACSDRAGWRERYPLCTRKNADGNCRDFVRAKPVVMKWWETLLWFSSGVQRAVRRRMRA